MPTSRLVHPAAAWSEKPRTHGAITSHAPKATLVHSGATVGFAIATMAAIAMAAPKITAFHVIAVLPFPASHGDTQRSAPSTRFVRSGQELIGGLDVPVMFVFTISLRSWVIEVPTECANSRSVATARGSHSVGIDIGCQKTRGEPRCIDCAETIATGAWVHGVANRAVGHHGAHAEQQTLAPRSANRQRMIRCLAWCRDAVIGVPILRQRQNEDGCQGAA